MTDQREELAFASLVRAVEKRMEDGFKALETRVADGMEAVRNEIQSTRVDREHGDNTLKALRDVDLARLDRLDASVREHDRQMAELRSAQASMQVDLNNALSSIREKLTEAVATAIGRVATEAATGRRELHMRVDALDGHDGRVSRLENRWKATLAWASGAAFGGSGLGVVISSLIEKGTSP